MSNLNKRKENARIASQHEIAPGIFDMWIETSMAKMAEPGQFIGVYPKNAGTLLPRPISICEVNQQESQLRIVYRVAGKGTLEFSTYVENDRIEILGTIGNGFPIEEGNNKRVLLIGGGIGIPPMLAVAKKLEADKTILLGYRDSNTFLKEDFLPYGVVEIASEDGSVGTKGNVMNIITQKNIQGDVIFACGPLPMLRAIKEYGEKNNIKAYISLEEHMACGVGACLGCVCKTKDTDHHSHVKNARICTEGPVFDAQLVDI